MEDVLKIHVRQIERFGGLGGVRDPGLVEAGLMRPRGGYYRDILEEAAALWESLTMNRGFVDGNKRIGLACAYTFLSVNGYQITASSDQLQSFIYANLEAGTFDKDTIDAWLRDNTEKR